MFPSARRALLTSVASAATAAGLVLAPPATAAQEPNEVTGTARADRLVGSPRSDLIDGRGNGDMMLGRSGMDLMLGGHGRDNVSGGPGSDLVMSGLGADVSHGGAGGDFIVELAGRDVARGDRGHDWIAVGVGSDAAWAGPGRDLVLLLADGRPDTIRCGQGRDVVVRFFGQDPKDRFVGCEVLVTGREFRSLDAKDVPPVPPVLMADQLDAPAAQSSGMPRFRSTDPVKLGRQILG